MNKLNEIIENTEFPNSTDDEALYHETLITERDGENPLIPVFSIKQGDEEIPFGHPKSAITNHGSEKSGKGRWNSILIVAWLIGAYGPLLCNSQGRKVVILHSDDHKFGLWKLSRQLSELAGVKNGLHERLLTFCLRARSPVEMMSLLESVIKKHPDLGLLVLDLITDWTLSFNNEEESKFITDHILGLADKYNFLVIITIHESRLSRQPKGHLGAIWSAKSETVFAIKKRRGKFIATPIHCRGEEFNRVVFQFNGKDFTFLEEPDFQIIEKQILGDFTQTKDHDHLSILSRLVKEKTMWKPGVLRNRLREEYSKTIAPIGVTLSKNLLKYYRDKNWILIKGKEYAIRDGPEHAS